MSVRSFVVSAVICCGFLMATPSRGQSLDWALHPPPLFPTNEWGAVTNACQLGLRVPKFQYQSGDEVLAAVILRNVGEVGFRYGTSDEYEDYEVVVRRADGQTVWDTDSWARTKNSRAAFCRFVTVGLPPHGESITVSSWIHVSKRCKMAVPGAYLITVRQHVVLYKPEGMIRFDILSNPVTVTIVAPSPTKTEK